MLTRIRLVCYLPLLFMFLVCGALQAEPLKVGVIAPFTGKVGDYGVAMQNGITLAEEEYPHLFQNIEFIYENVDYRPIEAIQSFNKLRTADKVDLIYSFGVRLSRTLAPLAERYRLPLMAQSIDPSISKNGRYVIRFFNSSGQYAETLLRYTRKNGFKNIGIVLTEDSYTEEVLKQIELRLEKDETLSVIESFQLEDADFRSALTKIRYGSYDIVGVLTHSGQTGAFYRQFKVQNISTPTFGSNLFESRTEIKTGDGGMDGAVFANNFVTEEFQERYQRRFKVQTQITFAACAYEFALLVASSLGQGYGDSESLIAKLSQYGMKDDSVLGPMKFQNTIDGGKHFAFPIVMKRIQGDQIVPFY